MNDFSRFALLTNQQDWEKYKDYVRSQLHGEILPRSVVDFPQDPTVYPCLVSTTSHQSNVAEPGALQGMQLSCCFVYLQDAQQLLQAAQQTDMQAVPVSTEEAMEATEATPSIQSVLLLATLKELTGLGAVKPERLYRQCDEVEKWLVDNQEANLQSTSLQEMLQRFLEES